MGIFNNTNTLSTSGNVDVTLSNKCGEVFDIENRFISETNEIIITSDEVSPQTDSDIFD